MNVLTQFAQANLDDLKTVVDCIDATHAEIRANYSGEYFKRCSRICPEQQRINQRIWIAAQLGRSAVRATEKFLRAVEKLDA